MESSRVFQTWKRLCRTRLWRRSSLIAVLVLLGCYCALFIVVSSQQLHKAGLSVPSFLQKEEDFSACLLVMDDNSFLVEWLAYHYHAVRLRTLIVVTDPASQTSPSHILERWKDKIDITEWTDRDFTTREEFREAQAEVLNYFGGTNIASKLVVHRARQRMFYYKCLQTLQQKGKTWTLLTDTDEFVTINYRAVEALNMTSFIPRPLPPDQPGVVSSFVNQLVRQVDTVDAPKNGNEALYTLQSSPCMQIPRIRYGAAESSNEDRQHLVPKGYNASDFATLRFRSHTQSYDYKRNKISKTIIDLSRVSPKELLPVDSIHMPIRTLCTQRRLHLRKPQSLLVIHHYLGSFEQYTYREKDARLGKERSKEQWLSHNRIDDTQTDDDEIRPWLSGFDQSIPGGTKAAQELLNGSGKLEPKSWQTYHGNPNLDRCALCFFGLPRAYQSMVLPSIVRNLLIPNARHNCDVYVHFFEQYEEAAGRKNVGGSVNPREVHLLEHAVKAVNKRYGPTDGRNVRTPTVAFTYDTEEAFLSKRGSTIKRFLTTVNDDGLPAFYPYLAKTYSNSSLKNIVKQWHSIEFAFKLMDISGKQMGVNYTRIAMFRSDAMYLTPIDIALMDQGETDTFNNHVVVPPFAQLPINDRMIYGPYDAVKIWSTKRFEKIEERAKARHDPGFEMHSERFLNASIFPAIEALGYKTNKNRDICFVRTRADESAMISDCQVGGTTRGWAKVNGKAKVEDIVQRNCTFYKMGFKWTFVGCGVGREYHDQSP